MTEYLIIPIGDDRRRTVTGELLQIWARDALANGDTNLKATTDQEAIDVLEDCGFITIETPTA